VGVGESSSLGLLPRPARAGRDLSGGGGAMLIGDDADNDQEMSEVSEGRSATVRGMASVGMHFHEGRGATSPLPPPIPATSPLRNPSPCVCSGLPVPGVV